MLETHWHILGAGAMGCLFADALCRGGARVTLLLRDARRAGPVIVEGAGWRRERQLSCVDASSCGPISHLLVTTKAYDVLDAVTDIAHCLQHSIVLLLVNGMGLDDSLRQRHRELQLFCGSTTEGAHRLAPRHVRHAGHGTTQIGGQGLNAAPPWFAHWSRGLDNCHWQPDIQATLWSKLAINCVINPLTAIYRCPNGELARRPELRRQVDALCREVAQVSAAAGYPDTARQLQQSVARVIEHTAANRSSMLQDVSAGRPTEIDYITGHLLQVARAHNIPAAHNAALLERVKDIAC